MWYAIWIVGFIIFLFLLDATLFIVREKTVAVIQRFGKFHKASIAGLKAKIPIIDWVVARVDMRLQQLSLDVETKTKDNVFVVVKMSIQYQVMPEKVYEAHYILENPYEQIQSYVYDVVRSEVPNLKLDEVFEKKDNISIGIKKALDEKMTEFGYDIVNALVTDIDPASNVKEAMNRINAAERLKVAAEAEGEAHKVKVVKEAEATKARLVMEAEAESASKALQGQGIAKQREAIIGGLKNSVKDMAEATGVKPDEVMNLVLMTQYFDTLRDVGGNGKVIFMNHEPNALQDIRKQMLSAIEGSKA